MIEIRVIGHNDEPLLANVDEDAFDDPIDVRAAAEFLRDPRHHLAVAVDGDVVVGFASAVHYVHPDKPVPELWINEVGVATPYRRRGLGRELIDALLDVGRRLGCQEAWVLTDRSNDAAMRLYASTGGEAAAEDSVMFTFKLDG